MDRFWEVRGEGEYPSRHPVKSWKRKTRRCRNFLNARALESSRNRMQLVNVGSPALPIFG